MLRHFSSCFLASTQLNCNSTPALVREHSLFGRIDLQRPTSSHPTAKKMAEPNNHGALPTKGNAEGTGTASGSIIFVAGVILVIYYVASLVWKCLMSIFAFLRRLVDDVSCFSRRPCSRHLIKLSLFVPSWIRKLTSDGSQLSLVLRLSSWKKLRPFRRLRPRSNLSMMQRSRKLALRLSTVATKSCTKEILKRRMWRVSTAMPCARAFFASAAPLHSPAISMSTMSIITMSVSPTSFLMLRLMKV